MMVISLISFDTQFKCMQHLDNKITRRPEKSNVMYFNMDKAMIELYGGRVILRCEGNMYTANLLTEKRFKEN